MTEEAKPCGTFVHRTSKGYKRLFFSCSIPLESISVDDGKLAREPETVNREIAALIDAALASLRPKL